MRLKITHRTEYRYDDPIAYALQRVRLMPSSGATQKVSAWKVTIEGAREEVHFADHFDNDTRLISLEGEPRVIAIEASGAVETFDKAGVTGLHRGFAPLWLFMRETEVTAPTVGIRALVAQVSKDTDLSRLHQLMALIGEPAAEADGTAPAEASASQSQSQTDGAAQDTAQDGSGRELAHNSGGQDQAEQFIAAARLLGFPARYVSGYLLVDGDVEKAARHAWAEAHVDRLGWVGFDVANLMSPDEYYVRIATGRDHRDAMPVSGIRLGQADERLAVSITVEQ